MRIDCLKYEWANGTEDIDINFFSDVTPTFIETIDLFDYYKDETMSEIEYSFEDIDSDNTLYVKTSNLSFDCINDNLENGTLLFDFFEVYESNKYLKWKLNYYNDDDELIYSGIIYKDGVSIESVEDKILRIVCIGYEKEFKDYFINVELTSDNYGWFSSGFTGLEFSTVADILRSQFSNVNFSMSFLYDKLYLMCNNPYTFAPATVSGNQAWEFDGAPTDVMHLKTGYNCFLQDRINKFTFISSLLIPMGWIWYYYLGRMIIQERATTDYDVLEIDCRETEVSQSLSHRYNQFQVDAVIILAGSYFDNGQNVTNFGTNGSAFHVPNNRDLTGQTAFCYSNGTEDLNKSRPFKQLRVVNSNQYQFRHDGGYTFRNVFLRDEYNVNLKEIFLIRRTADPVYEYTQKTFPYSVNKSVTLVPYVNSRDNSGGLDINNRTAATGAYYGWGNFYYAANLPVTNSMAFYSGTVADGVFRSVNGVYRNYEAYSQTEEFTKNFKKFLKTNDEVIIEIQVKQLITNPLQTIHLTNYQDANLDDKYFSIIKLSFHPIDEISTLTLQMIQ